MEMNLVKGMTLRTKLIGAAVIISIMLITGGSLGLFHHNRVMQLTEEAYLHLQKEDPSAAPKYAAQLDQTKKASIVVQVITIGGVLICIAGGIFLATYFVRTVSSPLNNLVGALQKVSQGDLTVTLFSTRRDEIGYAIMALNMLVDELNQSLMGVAQAASVVATGSQELSAASEQLSSSSQEQASSLEETAASMEEMTSTVKQNADNAIEADKAALSAREAANEGVVMSSSLKSSMGAINASSTKIADIIGVIDEIAFQTNMLALNAAVEAARAGEQGRGFAVVAAEVRSLAQRSAAAAKQIKTLILESVDKVQDGMQLVGTAGKTLEGIVEGVKNTAELIAEISASSQEQAAGIEQVNRAITQMDGVTQSNAAQVEEMSGTSQSLAVQAEHLRELVAHFKLNSTVTGQVQVKVLTPAA
ncbi:MAG: methyl-accepting chemotaxis protein, partial [Pseudomonadota bacterium]